MSLLFELKLSMQSISILVGISKILDDTSDEWKKVPDTRMFVTQSRILKSKGLITVTPIDSSERKPGDVANRWRITEKGKLLLQYLRLEFADSLQNAGLDTLDFEALTEKKPIIDVVEPVPKIRSRRVLLSSISKSTEPTNITQDQKKLNTKQRSTQNESRRINGRRA